MADLSLNINMELVTVDSSQSDKKLDGSSAINDGNLSEISDDDIFNRDVSLLSLSFSTFMIKCGPKKNFCHFLKWSNTLNSNTKTDR